MVFDFGIGKEPCLEYNHAIRLARSWVAQNATADVSYVGAAACDRQVACIDSAEGAVPYCFVDSTFADRSRNLLEVSQNSHLN